MKFTIFLLTTFLFVSFTNQFIVHKRDLNDQEDQSEYKYYITDDSQQPRSLHEQFAADDIDFDKLSTDSMSFTAPASSSTVGLTQIENVTIKVGQQAVLPCFVSNLGSFKVIWAKNGDILALGSTKINSDPRLNVQHRYVSEWHLIIDNVVTDDEGEYICKTNGNFFKTINLQVLMPPTIDDSQSTPAGTITLKEESSITLKCVADGKPEPIIKWYRWKKYKHLISDKEELEHVGNEITINSVKRTDPNIYECIAKNSVPPATSRIFNIEIHYLPTVELEIRKTFQFLHKKFSIECKINSNPLEKAFWLRNGQSIQNSNILIEKYDVSNINDYHKTLLTLTVMNANKDDFGEYECCATNAYGQICSNIFVQEIKSEQRKQHHATQSTRLSTPSTTSVSILARLTANDLNYETTKKKHSNDNLIQITEPVNLNNQNINSVVDDDDDDNDEDKNDTSISSIDSLDSKDKRRHYLMKKKEFLHLESQSAITSATPVTSFGYTARKANLSFCILFILVQLITSYQINL